MRRRTRPHQPAELAHAQVLSCSKSGGTWSPLFGSHFDILITGSSTLLGVLFVVLSFDQ
ncbi:hypothetical protein [Streptomyces sp. HUAS TT7]|uniref:hypothetical protein n=1 Tax=Streptomyces sp. HUAS TT7 TaxID=3447507 RepID=UPI003F65CE67